MTTRLLALLLLVLAPGAAAPRTAHGSESAARQDHRRIAAGLQHACVASHDGTVKCWGRNTFGALGDGSTINRATPVALTLAATATPAAEMLEVSAGTDFTCALQASGRVFCTGRNNRGQLGDGTTIDRTRAVEVAGLADAVRLSAGLTFVCALRATGVVSCWGSNFSGQLGDANLADHPLPFTIPNLGAVIDLAAASDHACALLADGTARCWGANQFGQLGNGTTSLQASPIPFAVQGLVNATTLSAASQSACALASGNLFCWGSNPVGQLGTGDFLLRSSATFTGSQDAIALGHGNDHHCFVTVGGLLKCQGSNRSAKLGNGTLADSNVAVNAVGPALVVGVAGGFAHTCVLLADGVVQCVGTNEFGQLGHGGANGPGALSTAFVTVSGIAGGFKAKAVAAGLAHTCAVRANGTVACWGNDGSAGIIGNGVQTVALVPAPLGVNGLGGITAISATQSHTCALRADGTVACWGRNQFGQTGNGNTGLQPTPFVVPVSKVVAVHTGANHTCVVQVNGNVRCWGANASGQLGIGSASPQVLATPLALTNQATALALGRAHTCIRRANGAVVCWGAGDQGQMGDGTLDLVNAVPQTVPGLENIATLSSGDDHVCTLLASGPVKCHGRNDRGQAGSAVLGPLVIPTLMNGANDVAALSGGFQHGCFINGAGGLKCIGESLFGRLGNNVTASGAVSTPVTVLNLANVAAVSAGGAHTCAIRGSGQLFCFGAGGSHQLGNGSLADKALPALVSSF